MNNSEKTMEKIVALCKGRGFVYSGSEIYGGLANTWDYGPLGVEFKNNVKAAWRKKFVQESPYNVGLDSAILMNPMTWVASGHVGGFSDPLMDCKECKERFRADKVIEDWCQENKFDLGHSVDAMSQTQMKEFIDEHQRVFPRFFRYIHYIVHMRRECGQTLFYALFVAYIGKNILKNGQLRPRICRDMETRLRHHRRQSHGL